MNSNTMSLMVSDTAYGWRWNLLGAAGVWNGVAADAACAVISALDECRGHLEDGARVELDLPASSEVWEARAWIRDTYRVDIVRPGSGLGPEAPLVVATDGAAVGRSLGWSWAAANGQCGKRAGTLERRTEGSDAALMAELHAIDEALQAIPGRRLHLQTDSRSARTWVARWAAGETDLPAGCRGGFVAALQDRVFTERHRIDIEWVRGHAGHGLNERADALAKKARRRVAHGLAA